MNVLELFAGSRSFSKVAEKLGCSTYTTDLEPFDKIDQVCSIFDFDCDKVPFTPDIIWCSPPCRTFSIASCSTHFNKDEDVNIVETLPKHIYVYYLDKKLRRKNNVGK